MLHVGIFMGIVGTWMSHVEEIFVLWFARVIYDIRCGYVGVCKLLPMGVLMGVGFGRIQMGLNFAHGCCT